MLETLRWDLTTCRTNEVGKKISVVYEADLRTLMQAIGEL